MMNERCVFQRLQVNVTAKGINLDSYEMNVQWELVETDYRRNEFFYECCPDERYGNIAFDVIVARRSSMLQCFSVGMAVFISLIIPLVFALPCLNPSRYILGRCI